MSAGAFVLANYETDSIDLGTLVMPIRVQPETLETLIIGGQANTEVAGPVTLPLRVSVSAGNTEYGVKPRKITIRFTDPADLPEGYTGDDLIIPVLDPANYAAYGLNDVGSYLGSPIQVVSKKPESFR